MKKCILIIDWVKWHKVPRPEIKSNCIQAYQGHYDNLLLWDEKLETYLKEKGIDFQIHMTDYHFKNKTTK